MRATRQQHTETVPVRSWAPPSPFTLPVELEPKIKQAVNSLRKFPRTHALLHEAWVELCIAESYADGKKYDLRAKVIEIQTARFVGTRLRAPVHALHATIARHLRRWTANEKVWLRNLFDLHRAYDRKLHRRLNAYPGLDVAIRQNPANLVSFARLIPQLDAATPALRLKLIDRELARRPHFVGAEEALLSIRRDVVESLAAESGFSPPT